MTTRHFEATIGGRKVEAAGTLVHDDPAGPLVVTIAGAEVEFRFTATGGQNTVRWEYEDGNRVVIHCNGFDHPHGSGVQIPDLFDLGERKLAMTLFIEAMRSPEGIMRLINFTVF
jgi:hypothetical protein